MASALPDAPAAAAAHIPIDRLPPFTVVAGYHPMGAELDPGDILRRLSGLGATVVLPEVTSPDEALIFRRVDGLGQATPDLVIAPMLAFDRDGGRLGQGGGHYDRTIERLRADGSVFVIGLAYAGQEIDAVPNEAHDQRLDAILTDIGYRDVRKDA